MALTVKQLNSNVSFLLVFEPLGGNIWEPFRILLDPVFTRQPVNDVPQSESPAASRQNGKCVSLGDIPEPDLVIITQGRDGHLDEETLRQLPPGNTKTLILAEPSAAKIIESWGYFNDGVVQALPPWEDPHHKKRDRAVRLPVSPCYASGEEGEVTVSLIPQKRDARGVHSAIGITYRPPPSRYSVFRRPTQTPPVTPSPTASTNSSQRSLVKEMSNRRLTARLVPPTPPESPVCPQRVRPSRPTTTISSHTVDRALSVIYSPHGTSYSSLEPYVTSHLILEAALPLTAFLHSFGTEANPWWHLGNVGSTAAPIGQETALTLGARAWISTRDEDTTSGTKFPRRKTYTTTELRDMLVEILKLDPGQALMLTSQGIWDPEQEVPGKNVPDALGLFNNISN
ncbi:hypothetical protein PT974_08855 [Cladobotryum mycophilum]|uniref:Uncharacterized protein n=1 Tax=Cladobotryum mycophilum TaxID=491253 RepID=A0ABR0SFH8_9HYPO